MAISRAASQAGVGCRPPRGDLYSLGQPREPSEEWMSRVLRTSLVIDEPEPDHGRDPRVQRGRSMKDVIPKDTWTVFKIMGEFVEGFETLRVVEPAVSIFGGSRVRKG